MNGATIEWSLHRLPGCSHPEHLLLYVLLTTYTPKIWSK